MGDLAVGMSQDELACVYSAAILADDDIPVTSEKITTLLKAAEVEVEPIWPTLFARALQGVNIKEMITNIASCSTAPAGGAAVAAGSGAGAGAEVAEKKEEKKVEESESEDDDMGFGLFD